MTDTVERWCKLWDLHPIGAPTRTTNAVRQKVRLPDGNMALLKCIEPKSDEHESGNVIRRFDAHGCVRLLRADESVQLLEWIDGPPLSDLVREGRDIESAGILAEVVRKLHASRPAAPPSVVRLEERLSPLIARRTAGTTLLVMAAELASSLLDSTQTTRLLHGDIHHDNIMLHPHRGWVAIDPKGLIGDPQYELGNALCNPSRYPELSRQPSRLMQQARQFCELLSFDLDRVLSFALCHACLAEIWCEDDGDDPVHWAAMTRIIAQVRREP